MESNTTLPNFPCPAYGLNHEEWQLALKEVFGQPRFRADQIFKSLYKEAASDWEAFTTLPAPLRQTLAAQVPIEAMRIVEAKPSQDGTVKLLLACASDGETIESVLIPSKDRMTQCISTQAGCNFRCAFCASGRLGKTRDLTTAEIVAQVMEAVRFLSGRAGTFTRPSNLVVMGMGEPFDNYDNVLKALKILNAQKGLDVGARHITLSTCGVVPGIRRLAGEGLQFELSVSLHAPNQELRKGLMPVSRKWPLEELIPACAEYTKATGRLVTFEYTLIRQINDQPHHADELISLLRALPCKVNLIPLSPVEGFAGRRPDNASCLAFLDQLMRAKIPTTMRNSRGGDVDAACGQLRLRRLTTTSPGEGGNTP
ncbi:MAG: 23S rRNA (adenine(2503)-C(2))-methyltransferase RlmN [Kiritimatiellae bacterium]|nr:23S rRNA (adenine(2503)-C(2))-methyltransferase RlmN [Kiritimatiellia bacterium]